MGLDIAFNKAKAIQAGMEQMTERRGSDADIAEAIQRCVESNDSYWDVQYVEHLKDISIYIRVPGMEHWIEDTGVDSVVVRANKWGNTYAPLTQWLKANDIEWSEF